MRRGTPAGRSGQRRTGRAEALASLAEALFRETFPDIAPNAGVRVHPMRQAGSWHERLLVEGAGQRILLKVVPSGAPSRHRGSMATEHRMLTELAPRIREANPATGCPRVVAYRPDRGVLALEAIDGPALSAVLFGRAAPPATPAVRALLERCGEWLGMFHRMTRTGEHGNPFESLRRELEAPAVGRLFRWTGAGRLHAEIVATARALPAPGAGLACSSPCTVHGVFGPYHVLVAGEAIFVIDLESAHVGFPHVDLALLDAYRAFRPPWERARAARRCPVEDQRRAFLEGYARHAGPLAPLDHAAIGLARVHALTRFPRAWRILRRPGISVLPRLAWWGWCLRRVWRDEAPGLRRAAAAGPAPERVE